MTLGMVTCVVCGLCAKRTSSSQLTCIGCRRGYKLARDRHRWPLWRDRGDNAADHRAQQRRLMRLKRRDPIYRARERRKTRLRMRRLRAARKAASA